jgi:Domain of unknown function (DUF4832)
MKIKPQWDLEEIRFWRPEAVGDDVYLANPHKGCCTFQRFNGDALNTGLEWNEEGPLSFSPPVADSLTVESYLSTTVAYCRWFWEVLESKEGKYDFSMVDKSLEVCKERGQTLAVRLMPFGHFVTGQPGLPEWYKEKYSLDDYREVPDSIPDYNSPEYLHKWGSLIKAFATKYDSHPLLESFDIAYKGPWGEGEGRCTKERTDEFAELYTSAFKKVPLMALIAGDEYNGDQLKTGVNMQTGWRADCFGDLRKSTLSGVVPNCGSNHMYNCYPNRLWEAGAQNAWINGPVCMESCNTPEFWSLNEDYDIDFTLQQGLKYHTSYFMPKSGRLPDKWMDKLKVFCNLIGYRFVFRQAIMPITITAGESFLFRAWVENIGCAPLYRDYKFCLFLKQDKHIEKIVFDDINIKSWLPGDAWFEKNINISNLFKPGMLEVSAGIINPASGKSLINFANRERFADRRIFIGNIEINGG